MVTAASGIGAPLRTRGRPASNSPAAMSSARRPREDDPAGAEDVRSVRERDGSQAVLLDEQDGDPFAPDLVDRLEDAVDQLRREPERRLVEQEQARTCDQRTRDRELLLLPAREDVRRRAERAPQHRESVQDVLRAGRAVRCPSALAMAPRSRFSSTVSVPKMCLPSGTSAIPRRAIASVASPRIDSPR